MSEPEWLALDIVLDFHAEQLALFGGPDGIRDLGLLESALARPVNKFTYGETSVAALAAAYGFGIAQNHPFIDGNKRTALASVIVFLGLNGLALDAPRDETTAVILSLAAGEITEDVLAHWIADHIRPV
jgi:death-on-curing protein